MDIGIAPMAALANVLATAVVLMSSCGPVTDIVHPPSSHNCQASFNMSWQIPRFMLDHSDARACEDFAYTSGDYVSTAGAVIETDAVHPEAEAFAMEITPCDVYNWGLWQCPPVWRLEPTLRVPFNWEIDNGKLVNKAQAAVSYQAGSTTPDWTEFRLFLWHTFDNPIAVLQIPFDGENQT